MGTSDLPEIYTLALGLRPRARVYISGKSQVYGGQEGHSAAPCENRCGPLISAAVL